MKTLASLCIAAALTVALLPVAQAKPASPHHVATATHGAKNVHKATKKAAGKKGAHAGNRTAKKGSHKKGAHRTIALSH